MKAEEMISIIIKSAYKKFGIHNDFDMGTLVGSVIREGIEKTSTRIVYKEEFIEGVIAGLNVEP